MTLLAAGTLAGVSVQAADTGDAPSSYGLATHETGNAVVWLGEEQPDDNDPVNGPAADGDDNQGVDDEGGVYAFPTLTPRRKSYDTNVFAYNTGATAATLVGWVDFDGNGVFDADEAAMASVPPGASHEKIKLQWPALLDITTSYSGPTWARFRISTAPIGASDATGNAVNGEVEDYMLVIEPDIDLDEIPDAVDPDNDNDGIPDTVEVVGLDTDGDGTPDYLDTDSDNDGLPDYVEAGRNGEAPVDSDGDSVPDYLDQDSDNDGVNDGEDVVDDADADGVSTAVEGYGDVDNDGIANAFDIDADNDLIPDAIEAGGEAEPVDSDNDGVADYLDLDSDNDGVPDLYEASDLGAFDFTIIDGNRNGQVDDTQLVGQNGYLDDAETNPDSGVPRYPLADNDGDDTHDYLDSDADGDGFHDVIEAGGSDSDQNGQVDGWSDSDSDGIEDGVDASITGGADSDGDGIDDVADSDFTGGGPGSDGPLGDDDSDGIVNRQDVDRNGDGLVDADNAIADGAGLPDSNGDGVPDTQDASVNGAVDDGAGGTTGGTTGTPGDTGDTTSGDNGASGSTVSGSPSDDASESRVETGVDGGFGCSIAGGRPSDPRSGTMRLSMFWLMAFASALVLLRRLR
ncbi:MAG: hypothetical protein CSB44_13075 [Gammaproteobacteria bacterium]|nr:MAG: hypothetical protein CSB44_13075 [Gammaproteobacteria bacterium]